MQTLANVVVRSRKVKGTSLAAGLSAVQGFLPTVYGINTQKKRSRSNRSTVEPQTCLGARRCFSEDEALSSLPLPLTCCGYSDRR
jgi:hypothetical protein